MTAVIDDEISPDVIEGLVGIYLQLAHEKVHHTLFHEPTLWRDVRSGQISRALLLGILGFSARFSEQEATRQLTARFVKESKRLVLSDLENVCLENIQTCIIIGNICGADGKGSSEVVLFGSSNPGKKPISYAQISLQALQIVWHR